MLKISMSISSEVDDCLTKVCVVFVSIFDSVSISITSVVVEQEIINKKRKSFLTTDERND